MTFIASAARSLPSPLGTVPPLLTNDWALIPICLSAPKTGALQSRSLSRGAIASTAFVLKFQRD